MSVNGVPRQHLRREPRRCAERQRGAREHRLARVDAQRPHQIDGRQHEHQDVLPSHQRHDAPDETERQPSGGCAVITPGRPAPQESGDRCHRQRMRHRRLTHQIPEHERTGGRQGDRSDRFGRHTEETNKPIREP